MSFSYPPFIIRYGRCRTEVRIYVLFLQIKFGLIKNWQIFDTVEFIDFYIQALQTLAHLGLYETLGVYPPLGGIALMNGTSLLSVIRSL